MTNVESHTREGQAKIAPNDHPHVSKSSVGPVEPTSMCVNMTMIYDPGPIAKAEQPNSSGTLVAVIGVGLVLAILGIVVVAAVGLFWVRASRMESRAAVVAEQRAVIELRTAEVKAKLEEAKARIAATPDPRLNFELNLDREGNASVDGEKIDLEELRAKLVKLKDETSNALSVRINADPECPAKHIITVLDVCDEVGDVDVRIVSSKASDTPLGEGHRKDTF